MKISSDTLRAALERHVTSGAVPGAIGAIDRRGDVQLAVVGAAELGGAPLTRDAIFRISSMTKPITAAAALIAIADGVLSVDAPIDRWIPELANRRVLRTDDAELDDTVPAARAITVRDLLTFTMGFGILPRPPGSTPIQRASDAAELGQGPPAPAACPAPDEWLRRLGALPLIRQPGAAWMYGTSADVLGALIGRAAGSFEGFLHERLFAPLGMVDTDFHVPADKRHRLVTGYATDVQSGGRRIYDLPDGQWSEPPKFAGGAAGLVSTIDDFLAFARLLRDGGAPLIPQALLAEMTRDQLTPAQKAASPWLPHFFDAHGWGFGVTVLTADDPSGGPGAYGWDGGLGSCYRCDPATGTISVLFTQQAWTTPVPPPIATELWALAKR